MGDITLFIDRISKNGIYVSPKEPAEVSQAVIFEGLRFLQLDDPQQIVRESMRHDN